MLQNLYVLTTPPKSSRAHIYSPLPNSYSFPLTKPSYRVNEEVIIRLKWGQTEYKGRLVSIDSYMNIQLSGAVEYIDHKETGTLGQVLIRYFVS
jgi:small nuclear ribonucleoprotein (snRNP)-like protein